VPSFAERRRRYSKNILAALVPRESPVGKVWSRPFAACCSLGIRRSAYEQLGGFDESLLPLAHKRINLALAAYRGGRGELTPVLDARRTELDLRLQQLQLSADQGLAYAQLLYFLPGEPTK
jgi:hypothetical protein